MSDKNQEQNPKPFSLFGNNGSSGSKPLFGSSNSPLAGGSLFGGNSGQNAPSLFANLTPASSGSPSPGGSLGNSSFLSNPSTNKEVKQNKTG